MRILWISLLSVLLGFIGGVAATRVVPPRTPALINAGIVRAERFELADGPSLPPDAYWGRDASGDLVMAFLDAKGTTLAELGTRAEGPFKGIHAVFVPFVELCGRDGGSRFRVNLDRSEEPVLVMGTGEGDDRVLLGPYQGQEPSGGSDGASRPWALVFRDPSHGWMDYADIGMTTPLGAKARTGYVILRNSRGRQVWQKPK